MKSNNRYVVVIAINTILLALAIPANATVGYFSEGYGTKAKGMGGAGVALPLDTMIGAVNPAGMARVGDGFDIGAAFFDPERKYTVSGSPSGAAGTFGLAAGSVSSRVHGFGVPHLSYNKKVNPTSTFGVVVFGNGGMNTSYPANAGSGTGTFFAGSAGVNLEQLFISPTYARNVSPKLALGASITLARQTFSAQGLSSFGGFVSDGNPDNLSNRGNDTSWGVGGRFGAIYDASPKLAFGAAYQTRTKMGRLGKYSDLFADGGHFDIPAAGTLGLAYKTSPTSVLAFDTQYIWYSDVDAIGNPFSNLNTGMAGTPSYLLGGKNGPGFGWKDMTVFKLGYQQQAGPDWTVRCGASYGWQPIRSSEVLFNILAPGVQEWHYTLGCTRKVSKVGEVSLSAMYSPTKTVTGPNPLDAPNQQTIAVSMHQVEFEAAYGVKW